MLRWCKKSKKSEQKMHRMMQCLSHLVFSSHQKVERIGHLGLLLGMDRIWAPQSVLAAVRNLMSLTSMAFCGSSCRAIGCVFHPCAVRHQAQRARPFKQSSHRQTLCVYGNTCAGDKKSGLSDMLRVQVSLLDLVPALGLEETAQLVSVWRLVVAAGDPAEVVVNLAHRLRGLHLHRWMRYPIVRVLCQLAPWMATAAEISGATFCPEMAHQEKLIPAERSRWFTL
mmetsp:Transcript_96290/g.249466  ORF Transcript_96290/g.249466 Transcript_96290/m.249466 type:complete len:226 (+) Transcript_96290:3352-4029(+)